MRDESAGRTAFAGTAALGRGDREEAAPPRAAVPPGAVL